MKKFYYNYAIIGACLLCVCLPTAFSQNWNQILKLSQADRTTISVAGRSNELFGYAMASDGDFVAIGTPQEGLDEKGMNPAGHAGGIFIYQKTGGGWKILKKITAPDRMPGDRFGSALAMLGNTLIVGAPTARMDPDNILNPSIEAGAVYVYNKDKGGTNNWGLVKKLVAYDASVSNYFGTTVSLGEGTLAIGCSRGSVYIFNQSTGISEDWVFHKKLVPADPGQGAGSGFGYTVCFSNDLLAVGASKDALDANAANSLSSAGSVYIFKRNLGGINHWGQLKKVVAPDRAAGDGFGSSLAIRNGILVVGAPYEDEDATGANPKASAGSAYVFEEDFGGSNNWGCRKKLVSFDRDASDELPYSIAIMEDYIVLGARTENEDADGLNTFWLSGSAYVFGKNTGGSSNWGQVKKLVAPDRGMGYFLGSSLCTNKTALFIGAPTAPTDAQGLNFVGKCGAVYQFDQNEGGIANWGFREKIVLVDLVPEQGFGNAVAIDGDYAVVGHRGDFSDAQGQNHRIQAGSAWILKNSNGQWLPVKKLVPTDRMENMFFGSSVAISSSTVVVGAYGDSDDGNGGKTMNSTGAAYVFNKNEGGADNWGLVKKLSAPDKALYDQFGTAVAISGTIIAIGTPNEDEDAMGANTLPDAGSVYVFSRDQGGTNQWGLVKKLVASDRSAGDNFGSRIAASGEVVVAGAYYQDEGGGDAGAAYVFSKDQGGTYTWGQVKKLNAPDRNSMDYFGQSVAISGNTIIIGAHYDDQDANDNIYKSAAGSAYLFSKDQGGINNWGFMKKLVAGDRQVGDLFGSSVAIYDTVVVVGAPNSGLDSNGANLYMQAGSAYIFSKNHGGTGKWGQVKKIVAADRFPGDNFANSLGISNKNLLIGAYLEDEEDFGRNGLYNAGSVYFYLSSCGTYNMATVNTMVAGNQEAITTAYYNANCALVATVTPTGSRPVNGPVIARVWIESIQPVNYVRRHYEVEPYLNSASSTGRITLYFSQADFDAFNAIYSPKLPTGPNDHTGKANLLVEKQRGISTDGTGRPNSYSDSAATINPDDSQISWNYIDNRWEVSFDVVGFSGFFVKTTDNILPIRWLQVHARLNNRHLAEISWEVQEKDVLNYVVERSTSGIAFDAIGTIGSKGDGTHSYMLTDLNVLKGTALYRIRQTDKQGRSTYSAIAELNNNQNQAITLYPNPTYNKLILTVPPELINSRMQVCNVLGNQVLTTHLTTSTTQIELGKLPDGIYLLRFANGKVMRVVKQ